MVLVKEELGSDWLTNCYFRIGASSLLDNIIDDINETYDINVKGKDNQEENLKNDNKVEKIEKIEKTEKIEKKTKSIKES